MKKEPTKISELIHEPTEAEIQHAAYILWVEEGRPEGCDQAHWFAAKELLCHHHGRNVATRRSRSKTAA